MYSVYVHIAPNGKRYIGITGAIPEKRWLNGRGYQNNPHFRKAIEQYGWKNIKHEILQTGLTKEQAEQEEIRLIALYDTTNQEKGYNCTNGGESIGKHTNATKKIMSEKRHNQYASGELVHPMYGRHFSEESKLKMSKAHKGKQLSKEHKKKIGASCKGLFLGGKNPMATKVKCVETGEVFDSIKQAADSVGLNRVAVSRCVRGLSHTAGGYKWQYVTLYNGVRENT